MSTCQSPLPDAASSSRITGPKVHLHVHAADLAAAMAFYRDFFGEAPVKQHPGYAKFLPSWAPVNLAVSEHAAIPGGSLGHVGIQLPDAESVRRHLARVQAAGLPTRVETGVDCCHANQDKFWVQDPSGIEWEVYVLNYDVEPATAPIAETAEGRACCAPGCCR